MRKKLIAGNWKMNYTVDKGEDFLLDIVNQIDTNEVDVLICPNFTCLDRFSDILYDTNIKLGAQNVNANNSGAFTGEISCDMLNNIGVDYTIVGHSERRQIYNESNEVINEKVKALVSHDMNVILCIGETLEEREDGKTFDVLKEEISKCLKDISKEDMKKYITIAYEPIWAIGTGKACASDDAESICKYIREYIKDLYEESVSETVRILYGGSMKLENAKDLLEKDNIDGGLIGGASLKKDFIGIVNYNK